MVRKETLRRPSRPFFFLVEICMEKVAHKQKRGYVHKSKISIQSNFHELVSEILGLKIQKNNRIKMYLLFVDLPNFSVKMQDKK